MYTELKKVLEKNIIQLSAVLIIFLSALQCLYTVRSDHYHSCSNDIVRLNEDYKNGALTENYDINSYLQYMESDDFYIAGVIEEKVKFVRNAENKEINIRQKLSSSLFSDEDDQRKLKRDLKYVQYNRSLQVVFTNDLLLTSYFYLDPFYCGFILMAGLVSLRYLFISDYESDLIKLYKTAGKEPAELCIDKISALAVTVILLCSVKLLSQLLLLKLTAFPLNLPLQMVSGFSDYYGMQDVFQYLLICWANGILTVMLILIVFLIIYLLTKNLALSAMICGIAMVAEFLMNRMISSASGFAYLKNYNVIHLLETAGNTNGTNSFISIFMTLSCLTFVYICFLLIMIGIYTYSKDSIKIQIPVNFRFSSLIQCIWADIFIERKFILILVLLGMYIITDIRSYHRTETAFDRSVEQMREKYYGEINENKLAALEEKKAEYEALKDEQASMQDRFIRNALSEQEQARFDEISMLVKDSEAFEAVYGEIRTIVDNHGTYYLNAEGIRLLLQTDSQWYRTLIFLLILMPSLLFAGMAGRNLYHSSFTDFIFTSSKLKSFLKTSITYVFINSFIMSILVYGGRVLKFNDYNPFSSADGPVNLFLNVDSAFTLKTYLFIYITAVFLVVSLFSLVTVFFSRYYHMIQSILMTSAIAFFVYVLPFGIMKALTPDREGCTLLFIMIPVSCVLIVIIYYRLLHDKETGRRVK